MSNWAKTRKIYIENDGRVEFWRSRSRHPHYSRRPGPESMARLLAVLDHVAGCIARYPTVAVYDDLHRECFTVRDQAA